MLKVIGIEDSNYWDDIVMSFKDYDVYYLSGYLKAFMIHGDGDPLLFYFENGKCRGINVVMKRDISLDSHFTGLIEKNQYFDLITPYGYGGWIIEGVDSNELFNEYGKWCYENHIVSEFVRYHPVIKNHLFSAGYYDIIPLGETVAIDTSNKELIWQNFTPKNRNVIRKAINNGIVIKQGKTEELFNVFIDIYNKTMDKDNADDYYYFKKPFYDSIRLDLSNNSTIFYAELNETIIAASIMIFANGKLNYHLSGSLREYQHLAPSNLLLWKAAEWGNENGFSTFHLGGGVGSTEDSLLRFKKAFYRGELCRYHIGKKIINQEAYNFLLSLRNVEITTNFFPGYRAH